MDDIGAELLQAETDPAILKRLDEIIALLREIRDQGKPKEKEPPTPGPFMTGVPG